MSEVKASNYVKKLFRKAKQAKGNEGLSLKQFARSLAKEGDKLAQEWFAHKSLSWNNEARALRLKTKGPRIALEKQAKKMAQKKSKGGGTTEHAVAVKI
jgi:hypothetical protein